MDIKIVPKGSEISDVPSTISSLSSFTIDSVGTSTDSDLLAQLVLKTLLTKKGTVITNPSRGSSIASLAGQFNVMDAADAAVMIQQEIKDVEQQVISIQSRTSKYKPRERLQSISIRSTVPSSSSLLVSMVIINELNQASLLKVSV